MVGDLVAGLEDRRGLLRERVHRVPGDEERRRQAALFEEGEDAGHADSRAVFTALQHRRRDAVVREPDGERIEVERETDGAAGHAARMLRQAGLLQSEEWRIPLR